MFKYMVDISETFQKEGSIYFRLFRQSPLIWTSKDVGPLV